MSGRRLVLLRHGQTAWNAVRRVQGQTDVALDAVGLAQAAAVAPLMADLEPVLIRCSDLTRARQSAEPVAAACGLEATYDARLREFCLGEREGLTHTEYAAVAPEELARFQAGHYDHIPGAERVEAVATRMREALMELLDELDSGQTGLAVSHGAAIRVAVGALLGWPEGQYRSLRGPINCSWVELSERAGGGLQLLAYNRLADSSDSLALPPR